MIYADKYLNHGNFNTPVKISFGKASEYPFIRRLIIKICQISDAWISLSSKTIELKVEPYWTKTPQDQTLQSRSVAWTKESYFFNDSPMKNALLKAIKIASFLLLPLSVPAMVTKIVYKCVVNSFVKELNRTSFTTHYEIGMNETRMEDLQNWFLNHLPESQRIKFEDVFESAFVNLDPLPADAPAVQMGLFQNRLSNIDHTSRLLRTLTIESDEYTMFSSTRTMIENSWRLSLNKPKMFEDLTMMTFDSCAGLMRVLNEQTTTPEKRAEIMAKLKNAKLYPKLEASFIGTKYSPSFIEIHA